ncbi:Uma2 family endonuclease [Candidatus Gracilibacteria bacterium]|jgi:Uma2 family endonuclease|nr:Uma2 family endonuclease [Candidatus Gracilibacteria bacterium]NJM86025.1 Uma2 family endonuclease [Hydrococcus sp. RU_2_2]
MNDSSIAKNLLTDTWVKANWEDFIAYAEDDSYEHGRFYYDRDELRIEMTPLGSGHGQDNGTVYNVVTFFATLKQIRIKGFVNTSLRKVGIAEAQPDISFYIGSDFRFPPKNNSPIDINEFGAPALAIEIAATSLNDDLNRKKLLYEQIGIQEYWVVDVKASDVIAFEISQGNSRDIQESRVLPGLELVIVEEALRRSQTEDDGQINRWLIQIFS